MEKTKVFIVDDHQIFRAGLAMLLGELQNVEVVGQAANGQEFIDKVDFNIPDIVLMDITMPKMNGIIATEQVLLKHPQIRVIALSMHEEEEYLDSMLFAGAKGFLLKKISLNEIERAIDVVMEGNNYYSEELMTLLTKKVTLPNNHINGDSLKISNRELDVLKLICQGLCNQEIADKLFISSRTVENHRAHLIDKTDTRNSVGLVIYSIKNKLITI